LKEADAAEERLKLANAVGDTEKIKRIEEGRCKVDEIVRTAQKDAATLVAQARNTADTETKRGVQAVRQHDDRVAETSK
jgi:F0F1-type ATP synthase membrane subunit b/b'